MQLRPYQADAHAAISSALTSGISKQLLQAATGTGKTILFAHLLEQLKTTHPGKMLVLAHREELIDQAIAKMQKVNPTLRIDKEMAEHTADPEMADVIVASVSTLGRAGSKRILGYDWSKFDKFVVDEAHHAIASTYTNIFEAAGLLSPTPNGAPANSLLLGLTATPQRGDGQALAKLFQKIVYTYPIRNAIEDGWLVEVRGFKVTTGVSLDGIKVSQGDYDQTQLANTVNTPKRNQIILKAWLDYGQGRQTLGFTVDIQHAKDLAEMFRMNGVNAQAIWGDDPLRAEKLEKHRSGEITVLFNAALLIEGYDDWRIGCVILAGPTKSPVKFTQEVGRGTRLEELPDGSTPNLNEWKDEYLTAALETYTKEYVKFPFKTDCIIIDVVDASSHNSLVTLPTLMGLPSHLNLNGRGMYAVVKEIEEAQKQYPHIDFTKLEDIDSIKTFVQNVNLFEVKFPTEVETGSELTWFPSPTGGYIITLPAVETGNKTAYGAPEKVQERLGIIQNLLDQWEIAGTIKGKKAKGERSTLAEAFSAADTVIATYYPEALKILRRVEAWHEDVATPAQIKLLKKFFKGKAIPGGLSKGAASKLISQHMAAK